MAELVEKLPDVPPYFGSIRQTEEQIAVAAGDTTAYYNVTVSPVETDDGVSAGRVVLFSDVTARVRRKQKLEDQKERLEQQNERLDEFAGLVAHDLRNPLQVIEANLTLIENPNNEEEIEAIADATDRMTDLVDQILTLARSGGEAHGTEIVVLPTVASEAWNSVARDSATLNVETNATVDADPGRVRQLFENLFRNAVEHADVDAETRTRRDGGGDGPVVTVGDLDGGFYVEDDGPGFPEEVVSGDGSIVNHYAREGRYGLKIVGNVVEAHGWDLTVTNGADGGARFEIRTDDAT